MRIRKVPYAIIGLGAGPLSNSVIRKLVIGICNKAAFITVRDEESKEYLVKYGCRKNIEVTADTALCISEDKIPVYAIEKAKEICTKIETYSKIVFVHAFWSEEDKTHGEGIKKLNRAIEAFSVEHSDAAFIVSTDSLAYFTETAISETLSYLPSERTVSYVYEDPWVLTALLNQSHMVITPKLHVGIISSALGKVAVSFASHWKIPRFYKQMGAENRCVLLSNITEKIALDMLNETYIQKPVIIDLLKDLAEKNMTVMSEFLHKNLK